MNCSLSIKETVEECYSGVKRDLYITYLFVKLCNAAMLL